ncbi:EamA family transporter [Rhodobacteraceae bacterium 2CG4]|uniref:EamA family transporter n=1 Tax=Halovulum marinum TaxID=2662447 RepID=A0A6L5Z1S3_9RHOB|nr:DMT family transporter [Halovulum marinum]MSU90015.1 EamA family transporter [Halovulum marinum]
MRQPPRRDHPAPGPARSAPGPAHPAPGPARPAPGPARPATGPAHPAPDRPPDRPAGWKAPAALALTILIWASFLVATRAAVTARMGPLEVALVRFGTGAVLFLPVLLRHGPVPRGVRPADLVLLPLFGGVLFILLLAGGLRFAPVADSGVFTPSMLPLYVALLSAALLGERFSRLQMAGFAMIVTGALAVGGWEAAANAGTGAWRGHLMFTGAALSWAAYTVLFRRSGLAPAVAGAVLCFWSAVVLGAMALVVGVDFTALPPRSLALQVLVQGVLSGFVATFTFFYAVRHLGASRSAAFAALVPVLAAVGGWALLGEAIGPVKAAGIAVVSAGVALASGAFPLRKRVAQHAAHDV